MKPGLLVLSLILLSNYLLLAQSVDKKASPILSNAENTKDICGKAQTLLSADFAIEGSKYYIDSFTGTNLLAITPDETTKTPVTTTASQIFSGAACNYNITFHGVGESDGQAEFIVFVNDNPIGDTIVLPLSTLDWEMGDAFNTTFKGVSLANSDIITVQGKTASADGNEWSRARWLKLDILPDTCELYSYLEKDGYVIVEAESIDLNDSWEKTSSFSTAAIGERHIEYHGPNSYSTVPEETIIEYNIWISTPGTYQFKWRSRNGKDAIKFDEENDSWLKIQADEFYGIKDGSKTDVGDHFMKVWIQDLNQWSWNSRGEHAGVNGMEVFARFDNPGTYKVSIAGRSHNHPIDRFALYLPNKAAVSTNDNTPASEGICGGPKRIKK